MPYVHGAHLSERAQHAHQAPEVMSQQEVRQALGELLATIPPHVPGFWGDRDWALNARRVCWAAWVLLTWRQVQASVRQSFRGAPVTDADE
jgi:hypothetical protein